MPIELTSSHLLELSGDDAVAFAHSQFSNDVLALADDHWQWNAWLSPQGRVRAFFTLLRVDATHLQLILRGGDPAAFRDALKRFVFRAKVELHVVDRIHLYGVYGDAELAPGENRIARSADRMAIALAPSRLVVIDRSSAAVSRANSDDEVHKWRLADIRSGIPEIPVPLEDTALPQWLGLERLGAVSVRKGCYPGQEIMSRLHFKGGNKRSLYGIVIHADVSPDAGAPVGEEGAGGTIVMAAPTESAICDALAILPHASEDRTLRLDSAPTARVEIVERFG